VEPRNTHSAPVPISYVVVNKERRLNGKQEYELVEICLECSVLGDQDGLTIFLNHLEIVRRIYTALKEDPGNKRLRDTWLVAGLDKTYVLAAYLKNSVTSFVEPLRVMA
jgi:hypothetical protein